jgi:hypothetical protein
MYRQSPENQATDYVTRATEELKKGNSNQAYAEISNAIAKPTGAEKVKALFAQNPGLAEGYKNYLVTDINNIKSPNYARAFKQGLTSTAKVLPENTIKELDELLEARVAAGNIDGSIPFDLSGDYFLFKSLQTPDQKRILAEHAIANLQDPSGASGRPVAQLMSYANEVGVSSPMGQRIKSALPTMRLRRSELQEVARAYPDFAAEQLQQTVVKVHLIVEPKDRLLQEDLVAGLRRELKGIEFVQDDGPQVVTVTVERLRYNENRMQDRTETITYRQYEVNLAGALLLMPQNASYLYEVTTSSGEIEYGFSVKAAQSGKLIADDLIRDRITYSNNKCSNARIQNVFGGVQRAEFVANDDMVRRCNASYLSRGMDDLRTEVYSRVTAKIGALPPIARVQAIAD